MFQWKPGKEINYKDAAIFISSCFLAFSEKLDDFVHLKYDRKYLVK